MTTIGRFDGLVYIVLNVPFNNAPLELESHHTLSQAEVALKGVNAHELRNGRGPDYWRIDDRRPVVAGVPVDITTPDVQPPLMIETTTFQKLVHAVSLLHGKDRLNDDEIRRIRRDLTSVIQSVRPLPV